MIFIGCLYFASFSFEKGKILQTLGNILTIFWVALFSCFLTIYSNKTRHNANTYLNELIEAYLMRAYYIGENRLKEEDLKNNSEFRELNKITIIKYEMLKIFNNSPKQNGELEKYVYEYEKMDKIRNFLKFVKEEAIV